MKIIDHKQIDITEAEYSYYLNLIEKFTDKEKNTDGKVFFNDSFDTNQEGQIILIKTEKNMPWAVLFFLQQIMLNQRMRINDKLIVENRVLIDQLKELALKSQKYFDQIEKQMKKLEEK